MLAPQFKATECDVPLTPVPASATLPGEFVALLAIVTSPLTAPALFGANTTSISAVWFGAIVVPLTPLFTLNPVPVVLICDTVTLELPVLVTATPSMLVFPTISFPKFRLVVDSEMLRVAVPPLPLNANVYVGLLALLLTVMLPVALPAFVGANDTVKLLVCEAASVMGRARPLIWNPAPLTDAFEIVTLEVPRFCNCTVCEFVVPVATVPKLIVEGVPLIPPLIPVPIPSTGYCTVELFPLPLNEMDPENTPVLDGANFTAKLTDPPPEIVNGMVNPLKLNPAAFTLAFEMVTGPREEFLKVTGIVCAEPTATEPKFPGDGLNDNAVIWPCAILANSPQPSTASHTYAQ
jgi:hypothetical protein